MLGVDLFPRLKKRASQFIRHLRVLLVYKASIYFCMSAHPLKDNVGVQKIFLSLLLAIKVFQNMYFPNNLYDVRDTGWTYWKTKV